jgi:hypothetical protein
MGTREKKPFDEEQAAEDAAAIARAWQAIEGALVHGDPWLIRASDVAALRSSLREDDALAEDVRTLEVTATIDPSRLDAEDRELAAIPGLMAAGHLLAERRRAAANN